jgi:hypothetical protein
VQQKGDFCKNFKAAYITLQAAASFLPVVS